MKFNFPNILSLSRVLIAPLFFYFVISENRILVSSSIFLFTIGALTDYFDGYLARKFGQTSEWGRFMDPLADKILTTAAFGSFVFLDILPLWVFLLILIRDLGTTFLRIIGNKKGIEVKTSKTAKWKTFLQMIFIFYVLFLLFLINCDCNLKFVEFVKTLLYSDLTLIFVVILTIYTIFTFAEYLLTFYKNSLKR